MITEELKSQMKSILGDRIVFKQDANMDHDTFVSFGTDRTKLYAPNFSILAFPKDTNEVSALVKIAYKNNIKIVPSGGRTGYAGGAIAKEDEMVVSLSKMDQLIDFDPFFGSITVQAGMITKNLHKEVDERNFYFPVDFAATGSSHIGGNIATNAGGVRVVRYGLIRNWVLGMKVVTGTGEILTFNGDVLKNNTGYDLKHLFIGSEGTLGIITEVTLKLTSKPKDSTVLLLSVHDYKNILEIFKQTHFSDLDLLAFEFFTDLCLNKVKEHLKVPSPFETPSNYYVLIEVELKNSTSSDLFDKFLNDISELELITDGIIAQNSKQKESFWKYREGISESIGMLHTVHKNDVSLPLNRMEKFITEMNEILAQKYNGFEIALFGHIGDGNLHVNILKPKEMEDSVFFPKCKLVDPDMFHLIQKYNGSISAEHGIGLLKKDFLHFSRSPLEIQAMKDIKKVFDPKNLMNPGKVLN